MNRRHRNALGVVGVLAGWLVAVGAAGPDSPVADAAEHRDLTAVRELLRQGADVNAAQGDGMTALHWAARHGDVDIGEALLYAGANVHAGTRIGRYTPLHLAARAAQHPFVEILLDARADPNAVTTNSGATPLHLAAAAGDERSVRKLVQRGATVDARETAWGQTPLIFAAAANRVDAIRALLDAGADPNVTSHTVDVVERTAADRAADRRLSQFLAEFKKKEGGGTDWRPTPSQVQAAIDVYREVQRRWPNVPAPEDDDKEEEEAAESEAAEETDERPDEAADTTATAEATAAAAAADTTGAMEAVDATAGEEGADSTATADSTVADSTGAEGDPSEQDAEEPKPLSYSQLVGGWGGLTPLLHAVRQGHVEATRVLLDGGADINQPSGGDQTQPLLMAAINGQLDLALVLLEQGADPNGASLAGTTPLFAVLERQWAPRASYAHPTEHEQQNATYLEVMQALLEAGADPNVRLATHLWFMEYTFSVLGRSGINLRGATPFWRAAYALDVDAMRLLKDHGADTGIPTIKPPQRRRRPAEPDEEEEPVETQPEPTDEAGTESPPEQTQTEAEAEPNNPTKANAEGESAEEEVETDESGDEEEVDHSGVPPVPVGGPAIYPIHAASGVGYGQSFAGNAHRYVPDNWMAAVRFLVEECGADVNRRDANAYTALHHAASRGDNELILYLVERGADVTVLSRKGQTTADMANGPVQRVPPYPETVALLERLGATNNDKCVSC